jgi:DnaK suppressor protein
MTKKQLEKFEKLLLLEKQSIMEHLNVLKGASETEMEQSLGDQVDIASTEITQAALQKLGNRETKLIKKIEHALEKIASGEYGTCEMCGEDIGVKRLEARPVALFCIDCKTIQEQKERQFMEEDEHGDDSWATSGSENIRDFDE